MMVAPESLSADVECDGLLVLSGAEGPPLSVAEARLPRRLLAGLGDFGSATSIGNPPSARLCTAIHDVQRGAKVARLSDTPCKVISHVSHRKQTIHTLTKCHTFSCPSRAISWLVHRAFRIISEPISDEEPRVQGR